LASGSVVCTPEISIPFSFELSYVLQTFHWSLPFKKTHGGSVDKSKATNYITFGLVSVLTDPGRSKVVTNCPISAS
jgi:hypothetical protein